MSYTPHAIVNTYVSETEIERELSDMDEWFGMAFSYMTCIFVCSANSGEKKKKKKTNPIDWGDMDQREMHSNGKKE